MLPRSSLLVLVALLPGDGFLPAVDVRLQGAGVAIEARNVPLSDILDRLAQVSGMNLVYEGERPTMPVTVSLAELPEIDAVPRLLEGHGINYFIRADASGMRVDTLIITGRASSSSPRMASNQPPPRHYQPEPEERVEVYVEPEDPAKVEAVAAAHAAQAHLDPSRRQMPELDPGTGQYVMPQQAQADPANPYASLPPQRFPPGVSYPTP